MTIPDLDDIPCGCLITTRDRALKYVNRYFEQSYLWQAEQLIGVNITSIFGCTSQIFSERYIFPQVYKMAFENRLFHILKNTLTTALFGFLWRQKRKTNRFSNWKMRGNIAATKSNPGTADPIFITLANTHLLLSVNPLRQSWLNYNNE